MILERGTLLNNRYRIVEILGQGGMGSVYKAVDENLGMDVAVKDNLFTTEEYARQFRREAIILANLRHPNLPRVTDHFVIPNQGQYLVMDYIEGEDLRQRMERVGVLPEEEVIMIGAAMCDALSYLGSRKPAIIHRDIKPGNVKITPQGQIFLVDFGLAKTMQGSQATTTGARAMTPGFSPPEQYGTARTDQRSDVFSLGATLYAALTGATPEDALARAMDQSELTSIRKHNPKVSRRIASVIERALEVRPDARYQDADAFKQALLNTNASVRRREGDYYVEPPPEDNKVAPAENALLPLETREKLLMPEDRSPSLLPISTTLEDEPPPKAKKRKKKSGLGCAPVLLLLLVLFGFGAAWARWGDPVLTQRVAGAYGPTLAALLPRNSTLTITADELNPTTPAQPPLQTQAVDTSTPTATLAATQTPMATFTPTATMAPTRTHTPQPTPLGGGMGQLAYASKSGGISQVYLMNADGSGSHAITSIPEGACQPAWSPDGRKLVFISPCDSNTDYYPGSAMYIINVDGSGLLPLPTLSGGDYDPSWSPDGKYMAFTSLRNSGRPQLFILNLEDNQVVNISEKYGSDFQPRWSPDGRRLIFLSTRRGGQQVWVIDKDGQNAQQFTHGVSIINSRPSFSWNGESVIFTQVLAKGGIPRIIIAPLDFNNYQEYRLGAMPMRDASFSQDGHWVVFEGWQVAGAHDIYTVAASGAGLTQLTNDPALDFDPVWRPSAPPAEAND